MDGGSFLSLMNSPTGLKLIFLSILERLDMFCSGADLGFHEQSGNGRTILTGAEPQQK